MTTFFTTLVESLKDYRPENRHFTNMREINKIREQLGLQHLTNDGLCKMRDAVVEYFDGLIESAAEKGEREAIWGYMSAMQSITAVIDDFKCTFRNMAI